VTLSNCYPEICTDRSASEQQHLHPKL